MKSSFFLLSLPALGLAFPGMTGSRASMLEKLKERRAEEQSAKEKRGLIGTILGDVTGLLGSVASSVDPDDARPQAGYTFEAPGEGDSRGPCPGLNLLANYGYLPRDGYVTFSEVVEATAEGFNMGADLSSLLAIFAVLADGDIATESFYLGSGPDSVGGLNRHSTVEADVSPNREDYYNGCGDNHHLSSRRVVQNVEYAAASSAKDFGLETMGQQYKANAEFSQKYNPYIYYFPFPSIVSLGAFVFYPNFFSNGTYGAGGVANYESITSIIGAEYDESTGNYKYVPEKWPENWYRRSDEYGAVATVEQFLEYIYPEDTIGMPFGQLGTKNLNATTILCDIVQGLGSITPLALDGTTEEVEAAVTWALSKLDVYFSDTILGCPSSTLSNENFLYPNSSSTGGPLNPGNAETANAGNNVYDKVYFTAAPTTPQCTHTASA